MPRTQLTMDGNQAAAHVAYAYSDVAAIYPITPSSTMAELADDWAAQNRKNIFGRIVEVTEMQSEAGAAGALHGSLAAGALATTFTASQGLLLMIPNLYKIAGEMLPGVFHVAARTIATHALSIFGDHSDIYACRQTGVAMLGSCSVQEVMDLAPIAHLSAIKGRMPFIHFFDGFRTSHEIQKIEAWSYDELKEMVDMNAISALRREALNPSHAKSMGSAQNSDVYFQAREACNSHYNALPEIVESYMNEINKRLGTKYGLFQYYGAPNADHVIVAMGSVCETIEETVDYLNQAGQNVGLIKVRLYRPFSIEHLLSVIPDTVRQITVLDRTKEPGSVGEPLYLDVAAALRGTKFHDIPVYAGRYGLSSKDTTPDQIHAVYLNNQKKQFTVGIQDDVTNLSLEVTESIHLAPTDTVSCKFWGLGGDGTVSANKNSIKIIGNHTDRYVQAYFDYDSKKSGGLTVSHLRFGKLPIRSTYLIHQADFVACHNPVYLYQYNIVQDIKDGGTFLLNCPWEGEELEAQLPSKVKRYLAEHNIHFYTINAIKSSKELGLGNKINTILQSAFFSLTNIIPIDDAVTYMKSGIQSAYGKKGDEIVQRNYKAVEHGRENVIEVIVPDHWRDASDTMEKGMSMEKEMGMDKGMVMDKNGCLSESPGIHDFVTNLVKPINAQKGNSLPVSTFLPYMDGSSLPGSSAYERRNIATDIPAWNPENCIQCNLCAYVCPHAVIRPAIMSAAEKEAAPEGMTSIPVMGMPGYDLSMIISEVDCTGCGSCANICPGKSGAKALAMCPASERETHQQDFDYGKTLSSKPEVLEKFKASTVRGSQYRQPLLEFSGACAGCSETPYAKLVTQLFGSRMYIANATGCSSIWGNSLPSTPYTTDEKGRGPAWSNSLFEDAAEFGYGMLLAQNAIRGRLKEKVAGLMSCLDTADEPADLKQELLSTSEKWLDTFNKGEDNGEATDGLITSLRKGRSSTDSEISGLSSELLKEKSFLSKKSQWIFGGDGWAYDIGFGGLDHVLASGQDVNILVFDTEVYSNTGGQSSKATPLGSTAKFAAAGKETKKKDLAGMAMSYGYVYVAQIAMGANYNQTLKAITEAEQYNGPSLIIAYAPCINHGIRSGMGNTKLEEKLAVDAGYWHLFRFHPELAEQGKNPFVMDSKAPTLAYEDFLSGEARYNILQRTDPEKAGNLFRAAAENAKERYDHLNQRASISYGE